MAESSPGASIGRNVRAARERNLFSRKDLAERSGLSLAGIDNLERGLSARPRRRTIEKLAEALDVDIDVLMEETAYPLAEAPSSQRSLFNGGEEERRTPVLAKALATQAAAWLRAVADSTTDLDTALGIVTAAGDLGNALSIMLGDEESSKGLSGEDLGEITRAMKLLEDVAAQYSSRLDWAIKQAPPDEVEKLRQRKAKFAELERPRSRRSATA